MSSTPDDRVIAHITETGPWKNIVYGEPHPAGVWETHYCSCALCLEGKLKGEWRLCPAHSRMQEEFSGGRG